MTEAKQAEETKKERRIEKEIEINAPLEDVWKALTDANELARWFPLEARVTPGPGGTKDAPEVLLVSVEAKKR